MYHSNMKRKGLEEAMRSVILKLPRKDTNTVLQMRRDAQYLDRPSGPFFAEVDRLIAEKRNR